MHPGNGVVRLTISRSREQVEGSIVTAEGRRLVYDTQPSASGVGSSLVSTESYSRVAFATTQRPCMRCTGANRSLASYPSPFTRQRLHEDVEMDDVLLSAADDEDNLFSGNGYSSSDDDERMRRRRDGTCYIVPKRCLTVYAKYSAQGLSHSVFKGKVGLCSTLCTEGSTRYTHRRERRISQPRPSV